MPDNPGQTLDKATLSKIAAVAYGDASLRDRWQVNRLARKNPRVREQLEAFRRTAQTVRGLDSVKCPPQLIERVKSIIEEEQRAKSRLSLGTLAASMGAAGLVILMALFYLPERQPPIKPAYSDAELLAAQEKVEQSLAIISRTLRKTQLTLNQDILSHRVGEPLNQSSSYVVMLFKENES